MARVEVYSNCEWSDTPRYFEYNEKKWKNFVASVSPALDVPNINAVQSYFCQGVWMEDESKVFDFCNCDASWMQGNTIIRKQSGVGFNVVVMFFCKHTPKDEFWADFNIEV